MKNRVSKDRIFAVAAAAYDLDAELANPAQDYVMRRQTRRRLADAVKALTHEERTLLARLAGRQ